MIRYSVVLFGLTVFALALIWKVGSTEAGQASNPDEPVLWADTVHINVDQEKGGTETAPVKTKRDTFLRDVKKLTQTAFNIRNQYMEDVDSEEIIKAGIRGMLTDLDRYSVLMEKSSYDALMESTHGKYSGLGMSIDSRDDHIVIVSPIEGTPAYRKGLRAGDVIWKINDEPTEGMSSSDASKKMRGEAGTSVVLTIKRAGISDLLEFEVERAVISLKSVNYYGVVPGTDIGYVRLSRFAEETSHELREAIGKLNDENVSALIFDLRSNGGGLLDQAKETAELFLEKGNEIVYTKGKYEDTERHYYADRPAIFPDKPLVVLVDQGTASASEIVSGAVQDWDRGLIVGATTYGKGLVQQIFPLTNDGSMALKLTTARYYVPSGRCIQKTDRQGKGSSSHATAANDDDNAEADTMKVVEKEVFYTNGGRLVYGGGGVIPDIEVDRETWKPIEINLERKSIFFDFAVKYVSEHPEVTQKFETTEEVVESFRAFMIEREFDYKTTIQVAVENLREKIEDQELVSSFSSTVDSLSQLVEVEKGHDFDRSIDYIKRSIKREIVSSIAGERGVYEELTLKSDKAVLKAVEILQSPDKYGELMDVGKEKADLN